MPFTATWMNLNIAIQHTPVFLPGESPWTEEPGWLQSMGSQRVRHDSATKTPSTYLYIYLSTCLYLIAIYISVSLSIHAFMGTLLVAPLVKNLPAHARDVGSIPGSGSSPGEGNGSPLRNSCLEKSPGERSLAGYHSWGHKTVGGSNPGLTHCRRILYQLSHQGSTKIIHIGLTQ